MEALSIPGSSLELARRCLAALAARHATVAVAESLTGGLLGAAFASIPGASATFAGGCITYRTEQKTRQLGVPADLLATVGPVSVECAEAMVRGVGERFAVPYALAVTGVAGPTRDAFDTPVGTVYIACLHEEGVTLRACAFGTDTRSALRLRTVEEALRLLSDALGISV